MVTGWRRVGKVAGRTGHNRRRPQTGRSTRFARRRRQRQSVPPAGTSTNSAASGSWAERSLLHNHSSGRRRMKRRSVRNRCLHMLFCANCLSAFFLSFHVISVSSLGFRPILFYLFFVFSRLPFHPVHVDGYVPQVPQVGRSGVRTSVDPRGPPRGRLETADRSHRPSMSHSSHFTLSPSRFDISISIHIPSCSFQRRPTELAIY